MEQRQRPTTRIVLALVVVALIVWGLVGHTARRKLLRGLGSNEMGVRVAAARQLLAADKLDDSLSALPIINRSKTAEALGEIQTQEAARMLGVILRDQEEAPRRWAGRGLVAHGKRAVPVLMSALPVGGATRDEAVAALVEIARNEPEVAAQIRVLLSDKGSMSGAAAALSQMGDLGVSALVRGCYALDGDTRAYALSNLGLQEVEAGLEPALHDLNLGISVSYAIAALGLLGDRSAVPSLIPFLENAGERVRAATALGQIGDPRAVEPLVATLDITEKAYRSAAILALRRIGRPGLPALVRELRSSRVLMRQGAAAALVGIASPAPNGPLIEALGDEDVSVRASAAQALGWRDNLAAVEPLGGVLEDDDWHVVDAAMEGLGEVGVGAIPKLLAVLAAPARETTVRYQVARALSAMGGQAVPELVHALARPEPEVQKWCAVALGGIGDARAVEPLRQLAESADSDVKWVAEEQIRALSRLTTS